MKDSRLFDLRGAAVLAVLENFGFRFLTVSKPDTSVVYQVSFDHRPETTNLKQSGDHVLGEFVGLADDEAGAVL